MEKLSNKKQRKSWSKRIEKDGITSSMDIEELDNGGYLIRTNKYGTNAKGKYIDENKKFYSETNPLEPEDNSVDELADRLLNNNSLLTQ